MTACKRKCEIYSRVVGYHRPVENWNRGKKEEYKDRKTFSVKVSLESEHGKCNTLKVSSQSH